MVVGYCSNFGQVDVVISRFGIYATIDSLPTLHRSKYERRSLKLKLLRAFYSFGALTVSLLSILIILYIATSMLTLFSNSWKTTNNRNFSNNNQEVQSSINQYSYLNVKFKFVIPGLNVPIGHIFYIWLSGLISLIFHEIGHAVAASVASVQVIQFRVILYMFMIPVASTDLDEEDFDAASFLKRIQIITAGVYHNILICIVGIFVLSLLPTILDPFYETNRGIYVINVVSNNSQINQVTDGDIIISVNGLQVTNINQLEEEIYHQKNLQPVLNVNNSVTNISSYEYDKFNYDNSTITSSENIQQNDRNTVQIYCLRNEEIQLWTNKSNRENKCGLYDQCQQIQQFCFNKQFQYSKNNNNNNLSNISEGVCVDISNTTSIYPIYKSEKNYCFQGGGILVYPLYQINKQNNQTEKLLTFVRVRSIKNGIERWILFAGQKQEMLNGVSLSNYVPRSKVFTVYIPVMMEQFLQYLIGVSAGIAVLNMLPIWFLDGGLLWWELYSGLLQFLKMKKGKKQFSLQD